MSKRQPICYYRKEVTIFSITMLSQCTHNHQVACHGVFTIIKSPVTVYLYNHHVACHGVFAIIILQFSHNHHVACHGVLTIIMSPVEYLPSMTSVDPYQKPKPMTPYIVMKTEPKPKPVAMAFLTPNFRASIRFTVYLEIQFIMSSSASDMQAFSDTVWGDGDTRSQTWHFPSSRHQRPAQCAPS